MLVVHLTVILGVFSLANMKVVALIGALAVGFICLMKGADADGTSESGVGIMHGAKTQLTKGLECEKNHQWPEAREAYREILRLNPDDATAKEGLTRVGAMIRALLRYERQIAAARQWANKGDFQGAIRRFNEAMAAKPSYLVNSEGVRQLQTLLMAQNQPVEVTLQSDHETWVHIVGVKAPQRFGTQTMMILPGNYEVIGRRAGYRDVVVPLKVRQGASLPVVNVVSQDAVGSGAPPSPGVSSYIGKDASKDSTETTERLRGAAERGDAGSQLLLGIRFANGDGVPKDSAEAAKWFGRAARQGNVEAQFRFGVMIGKGAGVAKNSTEAAQWCRLAADRGHSEAQIALGNMYRTGVGVPKDLVLAHVWFNLAGAQGAEEGRKQVRMCEIEMTAEQRAEAMKLARENFEKARVR